MPHALSVSPRTLGVLLTSTLALACTKKDEPKKDAAPAGPETLPDGTVLPPPPVAPDAKIEIAGGATIRALAAEPEVLGHFMIGDSSRLLADLRTQIVTPQYAGLLEEAALRGFVSMALDSRANLAQNFDLAAPLGCALVDPKPQEPLVSCTFGYKGGAKAFVTDLGETNKAPDPGGHVAAYTVEGKTVYLDAIGEQVVASSGAGTFKQTAGYLQRNIVERAKDVPGDLELVVYVSTAYTRYKADIDPMIAMFSGAGAAPPKTDNATLDAAIAGFMSYRARTSQEGIQRFADYAQLSVFFSVEPAGVTIGGAMFPKAGSRAAQEGAQYGGTRLDPAFAGLAPSGTAMLGAFAMHPKFHESQTSAEGRKMIAEVWAPIVGRDAAGIEAAIAAFAAENAELYDGQGLFALGHTPGAPIAVTIAARLQAGKSARESYKAWSQGFTPAAVLGPEFSQYVSWQFTPDAANVDGVPVDRLTLEPGPAVKGKLGELPPDAKVMLDRVLGGPYLHIDRAEAAGSVVYTVAPRAEAAHMKNAIGALKGQGHIGGEPGLAKALGHDPQTSGVFALDLKAGLDWARGLGVYGADVSKIPPNLGTDLGDFYATFRYSTDGASAMEYVFSQQLIDQVKALIPN